jgi:non-specific serine/threonine protein kinase/serine/threonine-protein kinase
MDTKQVVARFESERQALALMDHPGIAKVLDAGATEQGRPYFAMEYVKGEPITKYCDRHRLNTRERLELFMQVCDGVQHAHQKGIIHRDLKPTNVLVTIQDDKPVPKIIDFGVAKATEQRLTEKTVFTQMGVLIGTPEYMSPEQAEMTGLDIDTRTDVYSLGVMLYELLVGTLPFESKELREAGFDELRRRIREDEPSRPSTKLRTLGDATTESAKKRRTDPVNLAKQLRGDLDWITMKALDKDRTRRYGSPSELAADIERHLKNEPVLASPPSAAYRAKKFVRRHRIGVLAASASVLVLIAFAAMMAVQTQRIAAERDRANRERDASEQVTEFLADMLGDVDPQMFGIAMWKELRERVAESRRGRGAAEEEVEATLASLGDVLSGVSGTDVALRLLDEQMLARGGEKIERELGMEPLIAGRLEHTLAETYRRFALLEPAERHALRVVEIRRQALGADHPDTLRSISFAASIYRGTGRFADAEKLLLETLDHQRRVLGPDHPDTLRSMFRLAKVYDNQERHDEGEELHRETLEAQRRVLGVEHEDTLRTMNEMAGHLWGQRRYGEAEKLWSETLDISRRTLGEDHSLSLWLMNNLALVYAGQDRHDEAEKLWNETLDISRQAQGHDHWTTLLAMSNLAGAYARHGRYGEARMLHREYLETVKRLLGDRHPETAKALYNLACLEALRGDRDKAMDWLHQASDAGFANADHMIKDPDLSFLHGDPEFEAIAAEVKRRSGPEEAD